MWRIGDARVAGVKGEGCAQGVGCNDVVRLGGLVFGSCWKLDGTVRGSEVCVANGLMQVDILAP